MKFMKNYSLTITTNLKKVLLLILLVNISNVYCEPIFENGFEAIPLPTNKATLGPLADAEIKAFQLADLNTSIEGPITSLNGTLSTTGEFSLELTGIPDDEWILVSATGGNDIDANDDGVLDAVPTQNNGTIYALAKAQDWREGGKHITALTDISWRYTKNLLGAIQPTELIIRQNELAKQFIQADINGDTNIDYLDILAFVPNNQAQRANLNFNYQKLHDLNANNESYILATHAGATDLVNNILDDLFAHTITRQVTPDHRYTTNVINLSVFGDGSISSGTSSKILVSSKYGQKSKQIYKPIAKGQNMSFTATPSNGYHIYGWNGCDNISSDLTQCFVNTNNNYDIFASFASNSTILEGDFAVVDISLANVYSVHNYSLTSTHEINVNIGYSNLINQMDALVVGDIITGTSVYDGYLGQVVSYTAVSTIIGNPNIKRYIIEASDISLDDVIKQGTGNLTKQLTNGELIGYNNALPNKSATVSPTAITALSGVKLIPSANADDTTFTLQFGSSNDKASSSYSIEIYNENGATLTAHGELTFNIDLDTGFNFGILSGLQDFKFITTIRASEGLNVTATGMLPEFSPEPKKIATLKFSKIKFFIGIVPVWVSPVVDFHIGASGEVTTTLTTGVTFNQTITAGIKYNKYTGFSPVKNTTVTETPTYPEAGVEASFKTYLKATASMKIYSSTGPAVTLSPYVRLDSSAAIGGDAWYIDDCVGGVDFGLSIGIDSEFFWDLSSESKIGEMLHLGELENLSRFELFDVNKPLGKWSVGGSCVDEPPFMYVQGNPIMLLAPYAPQNKQLVSTSVTLTNQGDVPLDWSGGYIQGAEIQVSPASGTLNAGESTVVNVSLETNGLPIGRYSNPLLFENLFDTSLPTQDSGTKSIPIEVNILPVDDVNTPIITSLTSTSAGLVDIQWSFDPSQTILPVNHYQIYSTQTPADDNSWNLETVVGLDITSLSLTGFSGGTTVSFYVIAFGDVISTRQSPVMSVTINGNVPLPATGRLNDTGITWGGDYSSGNNATCTSNITSPQDCHQGRDATHNDNSDGHAGFSFTKLDASGNALSAGATNWSCVRDNVTGLVWEAKTTDGSIHDKTNTYRWGGVTRQGDYGTEFYDDWNALVNSSNSANFCGFNDWRVPNTQELMSIVDNSRTNPSIDINYFPNTISSSFWSASPNASYTSRAWVVNFYDGSSDFGNRNVSRYVRLVRFGQ